jgi:hypothetical protein
MQQKKKHFFVEVTLSTFKPRDVQKSSLLAGEEVCDVFRMGELAEGD